MNILSLFDGMSGGQIALERAGIAGQAIRAGVEEARERLVFSPPSKDKLELLGKLKKRIP